MYSIETSSPKINILTSLQKQKSIPEMVYKNLSIRQKLNPKINISYITEAIKEKQLIYQPFWIAKLLVIASRKPFKPKINPYMIFVDGISSYRGILSHVPYTEEISPGEGKLLSPLISIEQAMKYVEDIQEKQINSMYLIKKTTYDIKEITLNYLPIWRVSIQSELLNKEMAINANTGEVEEYLLNV